MTRQRRSRPSNRAVPGPDQVADFLSRPGVYPDSPRQVERIETHISWVFLTDQYVYKLKKPVRFDFLDYSTRRRRFLNCRREIQLGRRLAPDVYLDVRPVVVTSGGELQLSGRGRVVEHVVQMRRLPHDQMLDQRIAAGSVPQRRLGRLVQTLVKFYREARRSRVIARWARPAAIRHNVLGNIEVLEQHTDYLGRAQVAKVRSAQLQLLTLCPELFLRRVEGNFICEGHGDLRPEHVCLLPLPVVFDPVEFNAALRSVDPIDELAFLAMECEWLGAGGVGEFVLREYQAQTGDPATDELIAFYRSYRACVRAKVELLRAAQLPHGTDLGSKTIPNKPRDGQDESTVRSPRPDTEETHRRNAQRYLKLAAKYADQFCRPRLLLVMGLMGSGKSTLASALAERLGFEVVSTDAVRRELAGHADPGAGYEQGIYSPSFTRRTYSEVLSRAREWLEQGVSVVLDGTFRRRDDRVAVWELAHHYGVRPMGILCVCPEKVAIRRIRQRTTEHDRTSDARPELYRRQQADFQWPQPNEPVREIRTAGPQGQVRRRALQVLRRDWDGDCP